MPGCRNSPTCARRFMCSARASARNDLCKACARVRNSGWKWSAGPAPWRGRVPWRKFRTMRQDAEADTGATWATDDDPRITRVGRFLRSSRLDEIPQLWCVLKGDMGFVGPRPERPEFVQWLTKEIPYYPVRNVVRPGITGWAQVRYKYGNTLEDAKEKLQYDLFYIKNASLGLDLLIMFHTVKIVILGRGAQ